MEFVIKTPASKELNPGITHYVALKAFSPTSAVHVYQSSHLMLFVLEGRDKNTVRGVLFLSWRLMMDEADCSISNHCIG